MDWLLRKLGDLYGNILIWRLKKQYSECGKIIAKLKMTPLPLQYIENEYLESAKHAFMGRQNDIFFYLMPLPAMKGIKVWTVNTDGYGLAEDLPWDEVTEENVTYVIKTQMCEVAKNPDPSKPDSYMLH